MRKRKMAVLLLLAVLILGGISPLLSEATDIFSTLLDLCKGEISVYDGGGGGGGGLPDGGGDGGGS